LKDEKADKFWVWQAGQTDGAMQQAKEQTGFSLYRILSAVIWACSS
jgi:hypothetical protein